MFILLVRFGIVLVTGLVSVLFKPNSVSGVLIATGVMMTLLAVADAGDKEREDQKRQPFLLGGMIVAALCLGIASGRWWGFTAMASIGGGALLGPVLGVTGYGICATFGIVSARLTGIRGITEPEGTRRVAELIITILVTAAVIGVLVFIQVLLLRREKRKLAEQSHLRASLVSEMNERRMRRESEQQSYMAERNARLLERENISRSIHNSVGHSITAAIMTLDAADMLFDAKPEEARKRMNDAGERIRGSLLSIRSAVRALDDEGGEVPISDLRRYIENTTEEFTMDTERTVDCSFELYSEEILVPKEHAEFLTGVLQECLSNGVRHGGADRFTVSLTADTAHVRLSVSDNGHSGFNEETKAELIEKGFGLKKIAAYVKHCGGKVSFTNEDGFRTVTELPLAKSN